MCLREGHAGDWEQTRHLFTHQMRKIPICSQFSSHPRAQRARGRSPSSSPRGRSDSSHFPVPRAGPHPRPSSSQAPHPRKATGSSARLPHDATMTACTSMSLEGDRECLEFSEVGDAHTTIKKKKTLKGQLGPW